MSNDPDEIFWLESTDRPDIGANLRARLTDRSGKESWRYTLFREAAIGDIVFHYDKARSAITSVSKIAGPPVSAPIVWSARGKYAHDRAEDTGEQPGYRMAVERHGPLGRLVTLNDLRAARPTLLQIYEQLAALNRGSIYFPFELSKRPVRPLQGYAFKLPAAVVAAFEPLAAASASLRSQRQDATAGLPLKWAIAAIEAAASAYAISELQSFRSRRRGLKRLSRTIFGPSLRAEDWTFHRGGRDELQFNVGFDQAPAGEPTMRAGVAFSFETSRTLPDIEILLPKVVRFNAWMRENPETLAGMAMWHWREGVRSDDRAPQPIDEALVRAGTFVFLGKHQSRSAFDAHCALETFDRLFPLYKWVEGEGDSYDEDATLAETVIEPALKLGAGRDVSGGRWIEATHRERTLDVYLRHAELQRRLREKLLAEGCRDVALEVSIGSKCIDAIARCGAELTFYEIKTASTVRACLREAIGQLLEYALWPGSPRPDRLVVVGEPELDHTARLYLDRLNAAFPILLTYRTIPLA